MASKSKYVRLYQDIEQNPELLKINVEVNQINDMIAKMGRSEYFKGISLPEQINKYSAVQSAKENYGQVKDFLDALKSNLNYVWSERRVPDTRDQFTGIIKSGNEYVKVLNIIPESAVKRSKRTGRGTLSEKAVRMIVADDVEMLKRLTHASEQLIMEFLNKWYESPEVSGGQLLEKFVDGVYKAEYSGQGASQSWGSPPVKMIIEDKIIETYNIDTNVDINVELSWEVESKMGNDLFKAWMNLFNQ